jgi:hypothetical protein
MKNFAQQNAELVNFDKTFDHNDFNSCVNRAMLLIRNREAQMTEDGEEWLISTETCRHAVEQAIINRKSDKTMMTAAIEYVERIENIAEDAAGI